MIIIWNEFIGRLRQSDKLETTCLRDEEDAE